MPGLYGAIGCPPSGFEILAEHFQSAWNGGRCEARRFEGAAVGGHAFGGRCPVRALDRLVVAVDGTPGAYEVIPNRGAASEDPVFPIVGGFLDLPPGFCGNAAVLEPESGSLYLAAEWAGAFPLYYARWEGGLLFASLLRPLARVTDADVDPLGLIQHLRRGYVFGDRTPFRGIHRLRPGEVIRFQPERGNLERKDRSRLWVGDAAGQEAGLVDRCRDLLARAIRPVLDRAKGSTLMMSGGWDSRTLLAMYGTTAGGDTSTSLLGYSHGDVRSRELRLVERLCREAGVACHLEAIDDRVLAPSSLARDFARTGTAIFPHWHRSAHVLSELGTDCAIAGVFGEVLGGHYGRTMAARGWEKVPALLRAWTLGGEAMNDDDPVDAAWRVLRLEGDGKLQHWYLADGFDRSIARMRKRINDEIRSVLSRLRARGIRRPSRLIEACIAEHRGSQYIAGQTVSLRTAVDVALPFADRELLHLASRIPARQKVHNAVNRAILELLDSPLLGHPMAATLVPASAPMPIQEASRAVRKLWETAGWRSYFASGGRIGPPRLSWVNFEFLRDGRALHDLVDDLRADIWDRDALRDRVDAVQSWRYPERLHPLFDQLGKLATVDLHLR